jgi:uncharacterized protein (DUF1501 family)
MKTILPLSRRNFIIGSACSAAAHPLLSEASFAAVPSDNRLVVILLRGAMDGLDVVRPVGAPEFESYRKGLTAGTLQTGGFFGFHPELAGLSRLWDAGELSFIHATSTPYRDVRSHFDGQDLLETGHVSDASGGSGWLNRAVAQISGASAQTAISLGREPSLILNGDAPVLSWAPEADLELSGQAERLLEQLYHDDPEFHEALATADILSQDGQAPSVMGEAGNKTLRGTRALADYTVQRLLDDTRIACFSISGWDTHRGQKNAIQKPLSRLTDVILTLKKGLGPVWEKTTVIAMTEFGRTARENGGGGTDHGTGGAAVLAGGAVRGGQVFGRWPGLDEASLYQRRDLMPTSDVRGHAAGLLQGLFGLDSHALETHVFPQLDMSAPENLLL